MVQDACDALVITQTLIKILEAAFFPRKFSRGEEKKKRLLFSGFFHVTRRMVMCFSLTDTFQ